jgi:hypothetical protein
MGGALDLGAHGVELGLFGAADIDREDRPARDHVARIGVDIGLPHRAHGIGLVAHGDLVHAFHDPRHAQACVDAHVHGGRAGMGVAARERDLQPPQALPVGDDADIAALGLQDGALFDVQFQHRMHLAGADLPRPPSRCASSSSPKLLPSASVRP